MPYLSYISDDDLLNYTKEVLDKSHVAYENADKKIHSNIIDPFSALFDSTIQGISFDSWLDQERSRQVQKTLQNAIGEFHQNIIGKVPGWNNPGRGGGYDLINNDRKILVEVKNKYNTLNSSASDSTYRKLSNYIDNQYLGYTAYVVFIIPKNATDYDTPWSPNQKTMPLRNDIRKADGESFYYLATGLEEALENLFDCLPDLIANILRTKPISEKEKSILKQLFIRAYK